MNTTTAHLLATIPQQAPALTVNGAGVGVGVVVIILAGGGTIYLIKHKKVQGKHAAVLISLGLAMAGTQIGNMVQQFLAQTGTVIGQILGQA